jgi:hypothetical protein
MVKSASKILLVAALVLGAGFALYQYDQNRTETLLRKENEELKAQKKELQEYIAKLTSSRRVAEMVVTDQTYSNGQFSTTLLFSELTPDNKRLPPRFFTIKGDVVHVEALTIRFDYDTVKSTDPNKGQSVCLFQRLYGNFQAPNDGYILDEPNCTPDYYAYVPEKPLLEQVKNDQNDLWAGFWKLAYDEDARKQRGVRLVQGEAPWCPVYPDYIYTLSIETAGGLTISPRPIDDLYRQFLKAAKNTH